MNDEQDVNMPNHNRKKINIPAS